MWVVLPQIPSGLYLFTFPSLHFPNWALGKELNINGWPAVVPMWAGWVISSAPCLQQTD